ncbi:quinol monooxygenase YgiN [Flavobacterium arsenatis]|uniref:Quinol monooxygenase YgiN n=1 Tax=Flavobacterium arsenatis TaxID=1484332 RepID=A0ABU1TPN6_9FLAO|nr:putative quinol monooxygenase [Flavobacterium arsenatis]MDR6967403.1 quinol monooxygenase YgiN [Flavobacterium arsenatis]
MKINITAIIKSKLETLEETKNVLIELAIKSKKETACIQYDLHQDNKKHDLFILHEIWESEEGLALHETQSHFLQFITKAPEFLAEPVLVYKTNKIA